MAEEDDKYHVGPMNEGQAQAWFKLGGDMLDKLELREISNLQLAMDRNPEAFTDAQRAQVKDIAWKNIENVAKGKHKLDPKETNNFKSMLDHVPASTMMEGGDKLQTFKDAEQKWFNTDRGIEEKSFGERVGEQARAAQQQVRDGVVNAAHQVRDGVVDTANQVKDGVVNTANRVKDGASAVKQHVSEKARALANKGKAVHRLNRMKFNRNKESVKQMFAAGKAKAVEFKNKAAQKVKQGAKTAAEVPFVLAFGVKELASMGYNAAKNKINQGVNKVKTGFNNQVNKVKNKVNNGVNKVKNFGKKVWNGAKKTALVAGYIVASPVILPYKAGKWVGKKIKNGVNWVRNGYNKLKAKAFGAPTAVAQDAKAAEKQAKGNQNKLSAEQVMANWKQIGRGESDGRYNMSRHSESLLNSVMKGDMKIDKNNASQIAAWLEVNRDIQDRINHNKVEAKNERNQNIAAQLEQFGIKNPYKTEETKTNETDGNTPPVQEPAKEKEQPAPEKAKEMPQLNPDQEKFVQSQLGILKEFNEKDGLKPSNEIYSGLVGMMEKGFAEKGITPEQMGAIREANQDLFPKKETEGKPSAGRAEMDKVNEGLKNMFKDRPKEHTPRVVKVPPLTEKQAALAEYMAGALKNLDKETPEMHDQYLAFMNQSFIKEGMSYDQVSAANAAYGMQPEDKNAIFKYEFEKPENAAAKEAGKEEGKEAKPEHVLTPKDPAYNVGNLDEYKKHNSSQAEPSKSPDAKNPETFDFTKMGGVEKETAGEKQKADSGKNMTPEQKSARKKARQVLAAQGRLTPAKKTARTAELSPQTRSALVGRSNANSA